MTAVEHWPADKVCETLLDLVWRTERRAGAPGIPHLVPGQHHAAPCKGDPEVGDPIYVLMYATADGHGIVGLFAHPNPERKHGWGFAPVRVRWDGMGRSPMSLPADFEPSEKMIATLNRARGMALGPGGWVSG